ncbi:MAG: hypothetical protein OES26_13475 [Gammaproteobacteria bacterium]|nr:hypothetical protein [Gammaproteobacteria bacterium]
MPITVHRISTPIDDAERAQLVFAGQLLIFDYADAIAGLCTFADQQIRAAFMDDDPETAQQRIECKPYIAAAELLQQRFRRDAQSKRLFRHCLHAVGVDTEQCYRDRIGLRILPYGASHSGGAMSTTHVHRDTWGSNLYQQVNWWLPVYPLSPRRTIAFYPRYWHTPIANTSDTWKFETYMERRDAAACAAEIGYPPAPELRAEIDRRDELRVMPQPGELLCFSGAHLHVGVTNDSDRARFSIESRTVSLHDISAKREAPNIDGHGYQPMTRWFRHIESGEPLCNAVPQ